MVQDSIRSTELSFKDLILCLKDIREKSFTGNLNVKVDGAPSWVLSFRAGRLGWVGGGIEPVNRWQRNLALAELNLSVEKLAEVNNPRQTKLDAHTLAQLFTDEAIDRNQCGALIGRMIAESLFDIIQFSQHSGNRLTYSMVNTGAERNQINLLMPVLEIEPILTKAIQTWQEWSNAGLAVYAPSLFPVISKSAETDAVIATHNLQQAALAIDGNRTLRSLAVNNRQSVLEFTSSLLPLLRPGFVTLSLHPKSRSEAHAVVDRREEQNSSGSLSNSFISGRNSSGVLSNSLMSGKNSSGVLSNSLISGKNSDAYGTFSGPTIRTPTGSKPAIVPLVACIDDSLLIYQALEKILTEAGYRSYGVTDPLKIMPSLIRNKPDFIFLDLLMPITNGYEVCEQIRKTPSLKEIPVIILTGKDGLVDRMRAKIVGATGFLGKPVHAESVLKMLEKYLVGVKES
jgi:two-component system, chemotaxis family, response regulator PixG